MNTDKSTVKLTQTKTIEELYHDVRHWKSNLLFLKDEIRFIDHLLDSYIFEPNTPGLFELMQDYQKVLKTTGSKNRQVWKHIWEHQNNLGGMLERKDKACDSGFYQKHDVLQAEVVGCVVDFRNLKGEIFNYASEILKKRKPKD